MNIQQRRKALDELRLQLKNCRLCLEAGYYVFPRAIYSGDLGARIMTIGQAPGITEKEAGRPFNAGSGSRLFKWLGEAGLEETWFRSTQYMSSVTKCYPGRTNASSGDRVPSKVEQQLCLPYLRQEIELIDPGLIIPIGRLAINLYYDKKLPLNQIIGTEKQVDGRWVVPLPHPSGASRWHQTEANRALVKKAIDLIRRRAREILPTT